MVVGKAEAMWLKAHSFLSAICLKVIHPSFGHVWYTSKLIS